MVRELLKAFDTLDQNILKQVIDEMKKDADQNNKDALGLTISDKLKNLDLGEECDFNLEKIPNKVFRSKSCKDILANFQSSLEAENKRFKLCRQEREKKLSKLLSAELSEMNEKHEALQAHAEREREAIKQLNLLIGTDAENGPRDASRELGRLIVSANAKLVSPREI